MSAKNNRRILVIDDNQTIHDDFRKILTSANGSRADALDAAEAALFGGPTKAVCRPVFEVDSALQGQDGLRLVEKAVATGNPYAVAFVDVRMPPGWDGLETASRIWKCDPDIQVVICTAYSEYSWEQVLEKLGKSDSLLILKKPFDNIEVLQLANALTEKWHLLQETKSLLTNLENKVQKRTCELESANEKLQKEVREREQAEGALRQSQSVVVRQERLAVVGQLSAGLAHEFNNILTVIQGHTNLLATNESVDGVALDSLEAIRTGAERAEKLTRQMLAFSRKQVMRKRSINLNELIQNAQKMLSSALPENIDLRFRLSASHAIHADPGMIEQILINLALNARDAMPTGGTLLVETNDAKVSEAQVGRLKEARPGCAAATDALAGDFVCITMKDTGCGMDRTTLQHLFEPFFTTKDIGKGTGLGLATVYGIVKQHGGWVEVASEVEAGTTMKVYFPPENVTKENRVERMLSPLPKKQATVLVVEDEAPLRALIRSILQKQGFSVLEASNGMEALKVWESHQSDISLLLTDMVMPQGISGKELAARLRDDNPLLPVIYSSGYSEEMYGHDLLPSDAQFLAKPYHPKQLIQAVHDSLRRGDELVRN